MLAGIGHLILNKTLKTIPVPAISYVLAYGKVAESLNTGL